jgi:hypothetical protein
VIGWILLCDRFVSLGSTFVPKRLVAAADRIVLALPLGRFTASRKWSVSADYSKLRSAGAGSRLARVTKTAPLTDDHSSSARL